MNPLRPSQGQKEILRKTQKRGKKGPFVRIEKRRAARRCDSRRPMVGMSEVHPETLPPRRQTPGGWLAGSLSKFSWKKAGMMTGS